MVKAAQTGDATPWHLDSSYFPTRSGKILSIWVPFDRATPDRGAVTYIHGSHHRTATHGLELIAWLLEPGDVLIQDVDTLHRSPRNVSDRQCRAILYRM